MENLYQQSIQGLESDEPETLINSALWLVENPDKIENQDYYIKACEILYKASVEDPECLKYIDENLINDPIFKAQLLSQVFNETKDEEVKKTALVCIETMIDVVSEMKKDSTELVAQIYSYFESVNDPTIREKAKKLL